MVNLQINDILCRKSEELVVFRLDKTFPCVEGHEC